MPSGARGDDHHAPKPPPAPPLPPQRYGQRAATAIARLTPAFLYGSRPSSAQGYREPISEQSDASLSPTAATSPSTSRSATHGTGIPIAALDISPSRTHAILAGRDILKTIRIHGSTCAEDFNLRSAIIAYAATHITSRDAVSAQHKDQLTASDVKWSSGRFDTTIATAATSGRLVIYDVNRAGIEIARLHEHTRQVHRIAFNPHQGALVLSGSQDATMRMWDLRALRGDRSVSQCRSLKRFPGNSDGVRDVRWSPADGVEFAACTDNGIVQRWDFRKDNAPVLSIRAHEKTCHAIDWHPGGRYVVSGGADRDVKVWDFKSSDRRMKPCWALGAPQAVRNVRWRPVNEPTTTSDGNMRYMRYCSSVATSYDQKDPRIHVWDFARPSVPAIELDRYDTPAADMLWHSEDLLWSVGTAGNFTQTDVVTAIEPMDLASTSVVASAPNGEIVLFSHARSGRRRLSTDAETLYSSQPQDKDSGEKLSSSQSATEGSWEDKSILGSALGRRRHKTAKSRLKTELSPPAGGDNKAVKLEDCLKPDPRFEDCQNATSGQIPQVFNLAAFKYLAKAYQAPRKKTPGTNVPAELRDIFESNAMHAEYVGQPHLAKRWRLMGHAVWRELEDRALEEAKNSSQGGKNPASPNPVVVGNSTVAGTPVIMKSPLKTALRMNDTASNGLLSSTMNTPLARPAQEHQGIPNIAELLLSPAKSVSDKHSGAGSTGRHSSKSSLAGLVGTKSPTTMSNNEQRMSTASAEGTISPSALSKSQSAILDDLDALELNMLERRAAINDYKAKPRTVLKLDGPSTSQGMQSPGFERHDSNESLEMFASSQGSDNAAQWVDDEPSPYLNYGDLEESVGLMQKQAEDHEKAVAEGVPFADGATENSTNAGHLVYTPSTTTLGSHDGFQTLSFENGLYRSTHPRAPIVHREETLDLSVATGGPEDCDGLRTVLETGRNHSFVVHAPVDPAPWTASSIVPRILKFHLDELGDPQLPSFATIYLSEYFDYLFEPAFVESYLADYHQHLISLEMFVEAAALRKRAYRRFDDIWGRPADREYEAPVTISAECTFTNGTRMPICPVCETSEGPEVYTDEAGVEHHSKLWVICQWCSHGGHDSCLQMIWSDPLSNGECASGCGCDCIPGSRRQEVLQAAEQAEKGTRFRNGSVLQDDWDVGESSAVQRVRGLVGSNGVEVGSGRRGFTSNSGSGSSAGLGISGRGVRLNSHDSDITGMVQGALVDGAGETSRSVP